MVTGEEELFNYAFVVVDDLKFDFIIGMDVLPLCDFGVERDSLWIGYEKTEEVRFSGKSKSGDSDAVCKKMSLKIQSCVFTRLMSQWTRC